MKKHRIICLILVMLSMAFFAIASGSSESSSYQLHNEDGSLNEDYVNNMNDYFEEHPEKLPD